MFIARNGIAIYRKFKRRIRACCTLFPITKPKKKNTLHLCSYVCIKSREREEKCGLFQRNKKGNLFFFLFFSQLLLLVCIGKQKKETVGTFGFSSSLKGRICSEKRREREIRGKEPPQERHACLCVVPFLYVL